MTAAWMRLLCSTANTPPYFTTSRMVPMLLLLSTDCEGKLIRNIGILLDSTSSSSRETEAEEVGLARATLLEMIKRVSLSVRSFITWSSPQPRHPASSLVTRRGILTERISSGVQARQAQIS